MRRIKSRISFGTAGLPGFPYRIFPAQNRRKPCRGQPMTVAGWTRKIPDRHSFHTAQSPGVSLGRFTERCRTPTWWRSARISSCSAAWLRKEAEKNAKSAEKIGPKGNRRKNGKPQSISQIGVYENHSPRANPIERCFGDLHDKVTRNHRRKRMRDLVSDVQKHLAQNGPWHYRLS